MRRVIILFVLLISGFSTVFAQSTVATGTVTASQLNVRTEPFAYAERIAVVSSGYTAGIIGKNADSSWYQILIPGGSGWVNGSYLVITNANTVPVTYGQQAQPVVAGGLVNTGALNVRPLPDPINTTPIVDVPYNTPLTITGRNADSSWYRVTTPGNVQGWVRALYVTVTSGNIANLPIITETTPAPVVTVSGYINTGALNLRSVPRATNNIPLRFYFRGTTFEAVGRTADNQWYYVQIGQMQGWMRSSYVAITSGDVNALPILTG